MSRQERILVDALGHITTEAMDRFSREQFILRYCDVEEGNHREICIQVVASNSPYVSRLIYQDRFPDGWDEESWVFQPQLNIEVHNLGSQGRREMLQSFIAEWHARTYNWADAGAYVGYRQTSSGSRKIIPPTDLMVLQTLNRFQMALKARFESGLGLESRKSIMGYDRLFLDLHFRVGTFIARKNDELRRIISL